MTSTATLTRPMSRPRPARLRAIVAREVLSMIARRVPVDMALPDGSLLGRRGGTPPDPTAHGTPSGSSHAYLRRPRLEILAPEALFERVARDPRMGIGEGYMAGEWIAGSGSDLAEVLLPFADRVATMMPAALIRLGRLMDRRIPTAQRNSLTGSRRNIAAHYDLSNDLFAAFLDETLTYSSALFDERSAWSEQSLEEAQLRKIHAVLDRAGVRAGSRVLEIGTGWGTLAIEAARRGAQVSTVTLSAEQATLARVRVVAAGLTDSVDIRLQDYREVDGSFDAIVSVEMIEAVGEEFWPTYFSVLDARLAPGGVVVIQAIVMSQDRYMATRNSYGWIQKHIFPGGQIPSIQAIEEVAARHTDLRVSEVHAFGTHYAETLRRWRATFTDRWPQIEGLGFDETFHRMWEYYLAFCEAGFDSGHIDVAQIRLTRSGGAA